SIFPARICLAFVRIPPFPLETRLRVARRGRPCWLTRLLKLDPGCPGWGGGGVGQGSGTPKGRWGGALHLRQETWLTGDVAAARPPWPRTHLPPASVPAPPAPAPAPAPAASSTPLPAPPRTPPPGVPRRSGSSCERGGGGSGWVGARWGGPSPEPRASRSHEEPSLQTLSARPCKGSTPQLQEEAGARWAAAARGVEGARPERRPLLGPHPALASVHRLLLEAFADLEVDLGGAHGGGRLDVELVPVLADLHVRLGRRRHRHLPEHGVHTCRATRAAPPDPWPRAPAAKRSRASPNPRPNFREVKLRLSEGKWLSLRSAMNSWPGPASQRVSKWQVPGPPWTPARVLLALTQRRQAEPSGGGGDGARLRGSPHRRPRGGPGTLPLPSPSPRGLPPPGPVPEPAGPGTPEPLVLVGAHPPARLPSALRSSSKFSLLRIFQVPAKLGMARRRAAGGGRRAGGQLRRGGLTAGCRAETDARRPARAPGVPGRAPPAPPPAPPRPRSAPAPRGPHPASLLRPWRPHSCSWGTALGEGGRSGAGRGGEGRGGALQHSLYLCAL
uniref:Uncharacterized protein n=1 Tax=Canis lupus familiaris TaxID=9615 RepID=A0A8C0Q5X9_CANLF